MAKKRPRVDLSGEGEKVPDDRMAGLAALREQLGKPLPSKSSSSPSSLPPSSPPSPPAPTLPWSVARTRAGGWPVSMEKRPGNRVVTIIGRVSGDATLLLSELKKRCGAGGAVRDDRVEIQGDHRPAVEAFLTERLRRKKP